MSKLSLQQPAKGASNIAAVAQGAETVSSGASTSTSRPGTPTTLDRLKDKIARPFRSSKSKRTTGKVSALPIDSTQQGQPVQDVALPASLIVPGMDLPFKGAPDDRAGEIAIYDKGIQVVAFLRELADLTGPGVPNPVPSILKALTGILTQLQQMVRNEGDWKELFLLISKHLETFNRQLHLLKLGAVTPDSTSALHEPIVRYSAALREMTAKILDDAGFDPTGGKEKSDWIRLVDFFGQYWRAGGVPGIIEDYRRQLSEAMDILLRDQILFAAVKMEETNTVVKDTNTGVKEILQRMNDKSMSIVEIGTRVIAKSLPVVSPYFVVRQQEMDHMGKQIVDSDSSRQKVFAIIGMGGAGKTQLVSYFMQETNKSKVLFTHIVFVDASSETNLEADLRSWARSLGTGHEQDEWNDALEFLASGPHEGRWALILDNADNPNLKLKRFFPRSSNGTILVTSRNPGVEHLATIGHLELERMSADDALATLESAAGRQIPKDSKEFESAQALMEELGCLPLALVHAGTYCRSQSSLGDGNEHAFTFIRYHSLFRKKRAALMKKAESLSQDDYPHGVYTALDMSYQAVNLPSRQFLHIVSNYHYSEISLAMFLAAAENRFEDPYIYLPRPDAHRNAISQLTALLCPEGEPDEFQLRELMENLRSFSLISPGENSIFLRMHPLVQSWVRDMPLKDGDDYQNMAMQIVTSCCLDKNRPVYQYLLPHINEILGTMKTANLHVNDRSALAQVLDESGLYKNAEALLEGVLESLRQVSEDETENMVKVRQRLASSYSNQGRWGEAERLQNDVLEKRHRILGENHPDSLKSAAELAETYWNQGRWDEAETLEVDVLEKRRRVLGADHPDSLMSAADLAVTYHNQGRWEEAEKLEVEVLEKRRRILGADHPDSLTSAANLAATYSNQGRWDEAEKLEVEVLEKSRRILGEDHPGSLTSASNLAETYRKQGRWDEAEYLGVEVLEKRRRILGADHPGSLTSATNLAATYRNQGRWDEAEKLQVEALENSRRILGADHPETIKVAANLALTYCKQGRWRDAESMEELVVEQSVRVMGRQHPDTQSLIRNLLPIYEKLEKHDRALEMKKLLIPTSQADSDSDSWETTSSIGSKSVHE